MTLKSILIVLALVGIQQRAADPVLDVQGQSKPRSSASGTSPSVVPTDPNLPLPGAVAPGSGDATGFSGKLQPASSNKIAIQSLVFRVFPSDENRDGIQVSARVNRDGTFNSTSPLPAAEISSIDTSPPCLGVETLDLRELQGGLVRVVENGTITATAAENIGFGLQTGRDGFKLNLGGEVRGAFITPVGIVEKVKFGGINLRCVAQDDGSTREKP